MHTIERADTRMRFYYAHTAPLDAATKALSTTARAAFFTQALQEWDGRAREIPVNWKGKESAQLRLSDPIRSKVQQADSKGIPATEALMHALVQRFEPDAAIKSAPTPPFSQPQTNRSKTMNHISDLTDEQTKTLGDLLRSTRHELIEKIGELTTPQDAGRESDQLDIAAEQQAQAERYRQAERARAQLSEVEAALKRMASGDYGYCEETGEPIGYDRLRANPTSRLSVEAQTRKEHTKRFMAHA